MNRYAVSDLHGQLDLYNQIKEFISNDDILYILGDCNDRGPYPWETLKAALDDSQCILLLGNHEYMLEKAMTFVLSELSGGIQQLLDNDFHWYNPSGRMDPITLLRYNGGYDTLLQWAKEPHHLMYLEKIRKLPVKITISSKNGDYIFLSHAGYDLQDNSHTLTIEDMVWDRDHYVWECEGFNEGDIMVHGHTPVSHLIETLHSCGRSYSITDDGKGCCIYNNGFKYDIDLGAHFTGRTCLLNLDTLETKIFETEVVDEY